MDIYSKIARGLNRLEENNLVTLIRGLIILAFWILVIGGIGGFLWEWISGDQPLYNDISDL